MKRTRRISLIALTAMLLLLLGTTVFAADKKVYKAVTLKPKTTVTTKYSTYSYDKNTKVSTTTYYRYKVTVAKEGFLTFTMKKGTNTSKYRTLNMIKTLKATDSCGWWSKEASSAAFYVPVSKGTYYFYVSDGQKLSYTFTAVTQRPNFTPVKAIALAKGTKVRIAQTPSYNYPRFYKINLTQKQAINLWFSSKERVVVLDKNYKSIPLEHASSASTKWFTTEKCAKGTYYLLVERASYRSYYDYEDIYYTGQLYWK